MKLEESKTQLQHFIFCETSEEYRIKVHEFIEENERAFYPMVTKLLSQGGTEDHMKEKCFAYLLAGIEDISADTKPWESLINQAYPIFHNEKVRNS